jgi:hypothetical protein
VRRDRQQVRPGPRDDGLQRVATATAGDPPAAGGLVRQLVQRQVGGPLAVDGEAQVGQRVEAVGVTAVLGDQHVRAELAQ